MMMMMKMEKVEKEGMEEWVNYLGLMPSSVLSQFSYLFMAFSALFVLLSDVFFTALPCFPFLLPPPNCLRLTKSSKDRSLWLAAREETIYNYNFSLFSSLSSGDPGTDSQRTNSTTHMFDLSGHHFCTFRNLRLEAL